MDLRKTFYCAVKQLTANFPPPMRNIVDARKELCRGENALPLVMVVIKWCGEKQKAFLKMGLGQTGFVHKECCIQLGKAFSAATSELMNLKLIHSLIKNSFLSFFFSCGICLCVLEAFQ